MVILSVIMTAIITPTVTIIYRPGRRFLPYKWRTIQRSKPDAEFRQTVDGGMEVTNPAFRMVNQNVLAKAPCSIGILVERRLSGSTYLASNQASRHIAVLFIGGTYGREALSYAWSVRIHESLKAAPSTTCLVSLLPFSGTISAKTLP
ncbi:hypothetical protein NC651_012778 [Populus alba x Populus x berolinensis]|nr:hypothetical protein NC651_012778 [Populus alba x Populus x berolinensis]